MTNTEDVGTVFHTARKPRAIEAGGLAFYARHASNNDDRPDFEGDDWGPAMFFDDGHILDLRGPGGGNALLGGAAGFEIGEVIITGRVPGALYADDLLGGETFLEHVLPLEYGHGGVPPVADLADATSGVIPEALAGGGQAGDQPVPANDDDGPAALPLASHGKDAEPLVLVPADSDGGEFPVQLDLTAVHDLAIPPLPVEVDLSTVTVSPPNSVEADPVVIGGPAYQSLSFLILDTPFVVGDDHLPPTVRPSIEELLGLAGEDTWVLPPTDRGAWLLH